MENNFPEGWSECSLGEIVLYRKGKKPSSLYDYPKEGTIPYILIDEMEGKLARYFTDDVKIPKVNEEGVLLVWDGSIGKCGSGITGAIGSTLVSLRPLDKIPTRFIEYTLRHHNNFIKETSTGTGLQHINKDFFEICKVQLPPLQEQYRIVSKIDALMTRVDQNKKRLEKIPVLLKRFRQSVLAAAVISEGKEILISDVCQLIQIGPFGTQLHKSDYINGGIPLINPMHIQNSMVVEDKKYSVIKDKYNKLQNYHLRKGDVIMGRRGEMARCALITEKEDGWLCGTGSLFFRHNDLIIPEYLFLCLSSPSTKEFLEGESLGTTMKNLNLRIANTIPINLPEIKLQRTIIEQTKRLLNLADKIESRYNKAKAVIDKLPQSILAKAFRGELVPQDPNDEPASVLLERIREEKKRIGANVKKQKRKH